MIQAITWALVPMSGAGMSRVGPRTFSILSMKERAILCSSAWLELVGRAVDAALGAAEGDAGDGGLPGHQRGERADLVDVDLGVEADAALVRAAGAVVLDAVAGVDVGLAVGELDRDLNGDLAVRGPEDDADVVGELEVVGGDVEVVADDVEVRDLGRWPGFGRRGRGVGLRLFTACGDLSWCSRSPTDSPLSESAMSPSSRLDPLLAPILSHGHGGRGTSRERSGPAEPLVMCVPPGATYNRGIGAIAQLAEHLLCKQGVAGSNPAGSTAVAIESYIVALRGTRCGTRPRQPLRRAFHSREP